jgi:signal transduction histidine kinase
VRGVGHTTHPRWRMRRRLSVATSITATAPILVIGAWIVGPFSDLQPFSLGASVLLAVALGIAAITIWHAFISRRYVIDPLEEIALALREFDPSLGDSGHPALRLVADEPAETAALKGALGHAVARIGRDRSQKEAVLGGLMHDLKTPLVAQSLLIDRLDSSSEEDHRLIMAELRRSSVGAVVRLNRLIDVLRVDSSTTYGERSLIDVRQIVDETIIDLAPLTSTRRVAVEASGSWVAVVERDAVQRAIENVVANAVRHAAGRVTVEVFAGLVRVADDGPGFAQPFEELVDPFQAAPARDGVAAGTAGLGLYIARRSLEAGGGRLKLESSTRGRTVLLLYIGSHPA